MEQDAHRLARALATLRFYYDQRLGRKARALLTRLDTVARHALQATDLAPRADDTSEQSAARAAYWRTVLRPLVVHLDVGDNVKTAASRTHGRLHTEDERDLALAEIARSLGVWDAVYPPVH